MVRAEECWVFSLHSNTPKKIVSNGDKPMSQLYPLMKPTIKVILVSSVKENILLPDPHPNCAWR